MSMTRPACSIRSEYHKRRVISSSEGRTWKGFEAQLIRIPAGRTSVTSMPFHRIGIHFGASVKAECQCDGRTQRRTQKHGDIDIIPAGFDGIWEDDADCTVLSLRLSPELLANVLPEYEGNASAPRVVPYLQLRDSQIEMIGWAVRAELEAESPSDPLYAESLGIALAVRLINISRYPVLTSNLSSQTLSLRKKRKIIDFIEANLHRTISLSELAALVDLSLSHFKTLSRNTFSLPMHQYVLQRRVERAQSLLLSGQTSAATAVQAGFVDQSHMGRHIKKVLGLTPAELVRKLG